ncbi:tellurium resistance protein [Defluviimonas sp. 20V17]|uniref:ADP-ribose pyrophosphatase n=1 Tax=Allgaiera indica TaxID=765699 RepID=A0AAN4ZYY4_9RHOB|nr:NUDIX domain-containing protein [Allgaiera indica]KDB03061.1 tellurium resistance protein [Defluviimonas sp. 20V17]GHE00778.1 tellurite resistance protein [Allgaiera indica]SDW70471.1 nudix-type nucleoside diphosphatase, YffH/AdpP family [Allgaiera indica]
MVDFFFYGTLCHRPLLHAVLGRAVHPEPARLPDHAVHWASEQGFPLIVARTGAVAQGVLLRGLTEAEAARLDYYEGGFGYHCQDVRVETEGGIVTARVYLPAPGMWQPGAPWSLPAWVARWGAMVTEAATEYMDGFGRVPAEQARAGYRRVLARAADRLRARAAPAPTTLRRAQAPGDLDVLSVARPWAGFFAIEEWQFRHRRFDGAMGPPIRREAFVTPDAVSVLPYDPVRDRVLVVEQFRAGPAARGDPQGWQLEAVAGMIDPGETPEQTARRECQEEAGLALGALHRVCGYYPSPGTHTEFVTSFIGVADLPDGAAGQGGLAQEHEDIRSHLLSFDALMALIETGEAATGPLLVSAFWLGRERPGLRAAATR